MTTLGEYIKVQGGYAYKSKDFIEFSKNKVLKIKNVRFGTIDYAEPAYVSDEIAESTKNWKVKEGDVLISMTGSGPNAPQSLVGRVARVWKNEPDAWINQRVGRICLLDEDSVHLDFIFYWLSLPQSQDYLVSNSSGSANQANISGKTIESLPCPKVDYQTSKQIADLARKFDEKVILNSKTNQTLEEMAQAIFKSWFVDFDPVKAKMNGEQPEGMDEATASLFPEKLVESELGLIPEGWSVEEAKSQLDVLRGFSYKGKGLVGSLDKGVPMHNLNSVLEGGGYKYAGLKFYSEEFKEKFAIKEGDVLVANTEQGHNHLLIGYGAMVPKHLAHGFFSHHTYRVRPKKNSNVTPEFIERLFGKGRFVRQVQGFTNGTTVNMLPVAGMEMPQFVVPSKALAQKFSELVKPMKAMIEENHKSNIELAKLRDTLLPKLLSGEIELGQAQELAEVE